MKIRLQNIYSDRQARYLIISYLFSFEVFSANFSHVITLEVRLQAIISFDVLLKVTGTTNQNTLSTTINELTPDQWR